MKSQENWKALITDLSSKLPDGSKAYVKKFNCSFNTMMINFNQVRETTKEAFYQFEKNVKTAFTLHKITLEVDLNRSKWYQRKLKQRNKVVCRARKLISFLKQELHKKCLVAQL
jgi:hypothetical protein